MRRHVIPRFARDLLLPPAARHMSMHGSIDPAALADCGQSRARDVKDQIELHRDPSFDPDNVGRLLGGDEVGIGTDCSHLDGPEHDRRTHRKIGSVLEDLFPAGQPPLENAMEIACASTADEMTACDRHEALKDAVREKYRQRVDAANAEKRRIEMASERLQAAIEKKNNPAGTSPAQSAPPQTKKSSLYEQLSKADPFETVENVISTSITDLMKDVEKTVGADAVQQVKKAAETRTSPAPSVGSPPAAAQAHRAADEVAARRRGGDTQRQVARHVERGEVDEAKRCLELSIAELSLQKACSELVAFVRELDAFRAEAARTAEERQAKARKAAAAADQEADRATGRKRSMREVLLAKQLSEATDGRDTELVAPRAAVADEGGKRVPSR
ncbi:hypothetical protein DIPPA_35409 [Diplonema papillatum]|nr:hypothetical protein DIPPA_35409 [Diplonema papillatum]